MGKLTFKCPTCGKRFTESDDLLGCEETSIICPKCHRDVGFEGMEDPDTDGAEDEEKQGSISPVRIPFFTILRTRQWTRYTCPVATFRLVAHTLTRRRFSEKEGMRMLGMTKEHKSIDWSRVVSKNLIDLGLEAEPFKVTRELLDEHLANGALIICRDCKTWRHWHVITVVGDAGDKYKVIDPIYGLPTKRDKDYVVASALAESKKKKKKPGKIKKIFGWPWPAAPYSGIAVKRKG